jgi:AcrR family transcriptional regulator
VLLTFQTNDLIFCLKQKVKMPTPDEPLSQETRTRLLVAAGEVFAEAGFRAATVRDICSRAGANVAAVNYYFGDKERLYAEVLRFAHECARERFPMTDDVAQPPEKRLSNYIRFFMSRLLDSGRPAWEGKLMAREMVEPTAALDRIVQEGMKPQYKALTDIVRQLLGKAADDAAVRDVVFSVVGQCVFYRHGRAIIERLSPSGAFGPADVERIADHITRFSIAAINAQAGRRDGAARQP